MIKSTRLAVDIGGTFTDVVLDVGGNKHSTKILTTHSNPADGVMSGIATLMKQEGVKTTDVSMLMHGTTLATNALIERNGAKTALITTQGHRDALEMALENRFEQYDVNIDRPVPLVPRKYRFEVDERLDAMGRVMRPLDEQSVIRLIPELVAAQIESLAIVLLHEYQNDAHTQMVAKIISEQLPHLSLSLGSDVCPEIREYERLSTTCANAYVKPLMETYLGELQSRLNVAGFDCPFLLMTSGGGLTNLANACQFPIRLVESGPAGGAILAATLAATHKKDKLLAFDMGGTTAKLCLIDEGQQQLSRSFEVDRSYRFKKGSGLPVRIPVVEMVEIGAGGGSIATVDTLQRIQVGPESAGSEPGPAAYNRGGTQATVTDADLVLGKLSANSFAGGTLPLEIEPARTAIMQAIGEPLSLDIEFAAFALSEVVDENMAAATRAHAGEWGKSLGGRTMVAFGGAAPLHANSVAKKLGLSEIIIPVGAGVGSAIGFLQAPISYEVVRSHYMKVSEFAADIVENIFSDLREESLAVVGVAAAGQELVESRKGFMRYVGQGHEVSVKLLAGATQDDLREAFLNEYTQRYGRGIPKLDIEVLSWTLSLSTQATSPNPVAPLESVRHITHGVATMVFNATTNQRQELLTFARDSLKPGDWIKGPAIIIEDQTSTLVAEDFIVRVLNNCDLSLVQSTAEESGTRCE